MYFFSSFVSESTVIVISVSLSFNSYLPGPEIDEALLFGVAFIFTSFTVFGMYD